MSNNEEVFRKINVVIYLSYTFNSKKVALFCSKYLNYDLRELVEVNLNLKYNNVLLVYPIHSEAIPINLANLIKNIKCNKMIVIATYGRINHGNSLYNLVYKYKLPIIAGCYFKTKHSYLKADKYEPNYNDLIPIIAKFNNQDAKIIDIKKSKSSLGYNFFPKLRAQMGVKIILDKNKCMACNMCGNICLNNAIKNGKINSNCIRCLACVYNCPHHALDFKLSKILEIYLRKARVTKSIRQSSLKH